MSLLVTHTHLLSVPASVFEDGLGQNLQTPPTGIIILPGENISGKRPATPHMRICMWEYILCRGFWDFESG